MVDTTTNMYMISLAECKLAFTLILTKWICILNSNAISVMKENVKQVDKARAHTRTCTFLSRALSQAALHLQILVTCQCSNSNPARISLCNVTGSLHHPGGQLKLLWTSSTRSQGMSAFPFRRSLCPLYNVKLPSGYPYQDITFRISQKYP